MLLAFNWIQFVFLESIQLTLHLKQAAALGEIIVEPLRYLLMGKKKKEYKKLNNSTANYCF